MFSSPFDVVKFENIHKKYKSVFNLLVYELNPKNYRRILKTKILKFKKNKTKSAKTSDPNVIKGTCDQNNTSHSVFVYKICTFSFKY